MSAGRQPRDKHYDGAIYARLIEPLLRGVHGFVADHLPEGARVLDACCGTGALARRLADAGRVVHGVDLSPRNIAHARRAGGSRPGLSFAVGDVSQLSVPPEGPFDVATVILALHEMPTDGRGPVLEALLGVARRVLAIDFAVPMPRNLAGLRNRAMELAAGFEHFGAFRDYYARGGLAPLLAASGTTIESERWIDAGALHVAVFCRGLSR